MKQLKSSLTDLRQLFDRAVTVRETAEPLVSFDAEQPGSQVAALMTQRDYDVVGLRKGGLVDGYVLRSDLGSDAIHRHRRSFSKEILIHESEPLVAAFEALRSQRYVFVKVFGHIGGIITRGDLQKTPGRLWLFGLVSLLEMQLLRRLRRRYPDDAWTTLLSKGRQLSARRVFDDRRRRNEAISLSDCLQLCDKAAILHDEVFVLGGFESQVKFRKFLAEIESLRNALAHGNDILKGRWPAVADLVLTLERILERLEAVNADHAVEG